MTAALRRCIGWLVAHHPVFPERTERVMRHARLPVLRRGVGVAALVLLLAPAAAAQPAAPPAPGRFGVLVGGRFPVPPVTRVLDDLHAGWVRLNDHLDGAGPDAAAYLASGRDVVLTVNNADPSNADTRYGSPAAFPNAGFPFRSKARYQERVRQVLAPLVPYLRQGRQVWMQCENEISDAERNPRARYWRGTVDQYATQLDAFAEAVRAVDPAIPVVLSSVASETLAAAARAGDPRQPLASALITRLLAARGWDAADLHFYGCVADIPATIRWVTERMPAGRRWISTENGGPDSRCASTPSTWEQDPARFEQVQARQVAERLTACADGGGHVCLWFSLFDLRGESAGFTHLGLLAIGPGGARERPPDVRRKPAYEAFKDFVSRHR